MPSLHCSATTNFTPAMNRVRRAKCQYTQKDIRGFQLPASGTSFPDSPLHAISAGEPSRQKLKVKLKFSARTSSVRRYLVFRDKTRGAVEKIPQAPTLLR
ncbi:uncharacterized protein RAG0_01854 [Rhynchosporium agropyri]|uniref:Uncharacterized protein n=1 Tax=Rhynchosporium agropyri TaxID=914238 RepID=A0A1E1JZ85_9HELO|nr:uncharacterized protein RAG0_01854 [Rhynchosporium agropyri]